jgi:ACS family hexuronate transporter-like MFS transporter
VCFVTVSLFGFLWVAVWLRFSEPPVRRERSRSAGGFGFAEALRLRQTRGFALSKVLVDPAWYFLLFWLPLYFRDVRGLEMSQIGWALPCIYFASGAGSVTAGWLSGFLLRRGKSRRAARLIPLSVCALVLPFVLFGALRGTLTQSVVLFSAAAAAHQAFSSISFTLPGDVVPSTTLGTVLGFGGFAGTLSSVLFSAVMPGYLIPLFGYRPLLLVLSLGYVVAVAVIQWHFSDFQPVTDVS